MSGSTPLSKQRAINRNSGSRARDRRCLRAASAIAELLEARVLLSTATFSNPADYPVSPLTRVTTLADFNGDGLPDIAGAVSQGGASFVTLLNNGNGTFSMPAYVPAGIPRSVAAADFNHDGRIDLAVAGATTSTNSVVLIFDGNGDGTFVTPPTRYPIPGGGQGIEAADLNGDGWADLVVCLGNRIGVLLNNGNGTFAKPAFYNVGGDNPTAVAVGDFNNDGVPDLAVARGATQRVTILMGNKDAPGTFGGPMFLPASSNPLGITLGDFNHDGNLDIAVASSQFQGSTVNVMLGNGNGTFQPPQRYTTQASFSNSIVSGDFSGDGIDDLVVGSFAGNLKLLAGNGDGTFQPATTIPGAIYAQYLQTGDLNGDGKPDLIVTPHEGIKVLLNTTATGSVAPPLTGGGGDQVIGSGAASSFKFYAPDGTLVKVTLSGPGRATLHFSASTPVGIPSKTQTVPVTALKLAGIAATGTTARSTLTITTSDGSRTVTFDSLTTDGAFGSIRLGSANVNGAFTIPGGAKNITLLSGNGGAMTIGGGPTPTINFGEASRETIHSAVPIRAIRVSMDAGIELTAPSVSTFSVGGSLVDSTLNLTTPLTAGNVDLKTLSVAHGISNSTIRSAGSISEVSAQFMSGASVFAGVAALPPSQGLPAAPGDFAASAAITKITLGRSTRQPSFVDSDIAAISLGNLQLGTIRMNNGGTRFGMASHQSGTISGTDVATGRSFSLKNVASTAAAASALQARGINPQDFSIVVI